MGILDSMRIGADALKVHGNRIDIHSRNVANVDTPNYVRKIPLLSSTQGSSFGMLMNTMQSDCKYGTANSSTLQGGVSFDGYAEDPTPGQRMYKPGHPDADEHGYIRTSNVNAMVDIADAMLAQRAYEANLSVMAISKAMANKAIEIGRQ